MDNKGNSELLVTRPTELPNFIKVNTKNRTKSEPPWANIHELLPTRENKVIIELIILLET